MIVDTHVHFWDPGALEYPWLSSAPALQRSFLPSDYAAASAGTDVARLVFVEANAAPHLAEREIELVERVAAPDDQRIAAIVAYADLTDAGGRERMLEALSAHARVKGIRQNIQGQPRGFALQNVFVDGVRSVGRYGLSFDLCVTRDQLPETIALVAECPGTRIVLDHCGKPAIGPGDDDGWSRDLACLARFDNVWCKISGLLTEQTAESTPDDVLRYAAHAAECFGRQRVLYGSDWPVLTLAGDYATWLEITRMLTSRWSAGERRQFYADNAIEFYRL